MKITRKELREIIEEVATELGILEFDEGNAFGAAVKKAKEAGEDEFEVDGESFKVREWTDADDARRAKERQRISPSYKVKEELTAAQEKLPEPLKQAILKKQGNDDGESTEEDDEEVAEGLTAAQEKLPEPLKQAILKKQGNAGESTEEDDEEAIEEGNAWGNAVRKAREENLQEFEFNGKTYQVMENGHPAHPVDDTEEFVGDIGDDDVEEGNAFGAAVKKAKEAGEDEFEVDGETFKVKEVEEKGIRELTKCSLSETFARITGKKRVLLD